MLDAETLSEGEHTVTARVRFSWSSQFTISAQFVVGPTGDGSGPPSQPPETPPTTLPVPPTTEAPTPPTTPPPTTPPSSGAWPGASNTGVPEGTDLKVLNGDLTVSAPGAVIDALHVTGHIYVAADNVTIKNSQADQGLSAHQGSNQRTIIQDSEFGSAASPTDDMGVDIINTTILRSNIHDFADGIRSNGGNVIQDNWIHDFVLDGDNHNDGIQRYAPGGDPGNGFRERIVHNTINCAGCTNAAIFYADDWRGTLTVDNNLLSGGGYSLRLHESGTANVTNNHFVRNSYVAGPTNFLYGNIAEFLGNVFDDNGQVLSE